jgi:predicted ATPase/class 3 adenylate cyclase
MSEVPTGTVTFLFTDIEGSTTRWEQHPEAMRTALARHDALLRSVITSHGGYVFKMVGDAVYAAFAVATDAVEAAVAAQRGVAAEEWGEVSPLRVRMAVHTGAVQSRDDDYFGPTLNRVARLLSTGYGGQVLLSAVTYELVRDTMPDGTSVKDLGEHAFKDLLRPEHVYQLTLPDLPGDFPALKSLSRRTQNLPVQPTPLIGREQEVESVCRLLRRPEVRLVTLTGPGGVGKTRLSLQIAAELADEFADGVFLVPLAPVSDPELVVSTIAQVLAVQEVGQQLLFALLVNALKDKQLLLVLDNVEQVAAAAVQVAELLATCPQLKVLATSRVVLHVRAEHEFVVPPLALPNLERLPNLVALSQFEAVALFIERAQTVKADFAVTNANAPAVAAICARLDGLPLAIELAAARVKYFPVQTLLTRLEQGLSVLSGGARDLPARQQTLRGAIAWSYDLLSPGEQQLFRRLSVFVNGCTLEAVEEVCTAAGQFAGDMLEGLIPLVDKSLLRQAEEAEGTEAEGGPRFWMLQTLREFGLEALAANGEMEATQQAHAEYYLALAERAEPEIRSARQLLWLAQLEFEHDNLRAAMRWSVEHREMEMPLRFGSALWYFWALHGYWSEGSTFLERSLAASEGVSIAVRAKALIGAGVLIGNQGDHKRGMALCEESLALFREMGEPQGIALSLLWLGEIAWWAGNLTEPRPLVEEALSIYRTLDDEWGTTSSLEILATVALDQGEYTRARSLLEESLARSRKAGDKRGIANSLLAWSWMLLFSEGDYVKIRPMLEESLALSREMGDRGLASFGALFLLGITDFFQGEQTRSRSLFDESLALARKTGNQRGMAGSFFGLGMLTFAQGDAVAAQALLEESLAIWRKIENQPMMVYCLENLAAVVAAQGQLISGVRLWGAVEKLREASSIRPTPPSMRVFYEQVMANTRASLGEEGFETAWAEGQTMPLDEILNDVLKKDGEVEVN